jgi:hypothetical protein
LAGVTAEERATYAATLPRSTHEERMYADWVEDYTAAIDKHLTEDSTTFAIRQGWYGDDQAFNSVASPVSDNLEEVLIARTQRNMNTRVKTGISSGPLTTEEAQVFAEYWRTASTDERLAMSERVSGAIGGGGLAFFKQLGKAVGDSSVAAGALATEQGATADDKESARLILDGQKVLADDTVKPFKNTGSVENQAYHLVAPLIGENFPGRRDAVIDSVVSYLAGKYTREGKSEQDPGKGTVQKAVAAVLGREVIKPDVNGFGLFGSGTSIIAPKGVNQRGWGKWLSDERFTKYIDESGGVAGYRSSYIQDGIKRGEIMLMPTDRDGEWLLTTDGRRALGNKTTGKHFRLKYSAGYTADGN